MKIVSDIKAQKLGAVILAAGYSKRMGGFKPLLPLGSATVIERLVDTFLKAGVLHLLVVTGFRSAEIESCLSTRSITCVFNAQFAASMFVSLQAGIRALDRNLEGFFVMPADMPFVHPYTIICMKKAFMQYKAAVLYPVFNGRRGHPPLLSMELAEKLLVWEGDGGLREFLKSYNDQAVEIAVEDEGILLDLDNKEDYFRAIERDDDV